MTRWQEIEAKVRYKGYYLDDAEFVVVGFGTLEGFAFSGAAARRGQSWTGATDHPGALLAVLVNWRNR